MAFTEFCCRASGSNLNAGTRTGSSTEPGTGADLTYASGNWVQSTGVFTVASGNPSGDGVVAGDFASVYADGSTVTGFVGRVTAADATTITVSLTAKIGTPPTDGTGNRTLKIGGAWLGPNAGVGFPYTLIDGNCANASSHRMRVNLKNDQTYSMTSAVLANANNADGWTLQGYTSAYGDFGRATIQGPATGASFLLFSAAANTNFVVADIIFSQNGDSGSANLVSSNAVGQFLRCVANASRGAGFISTGTILYLECEAYGNNLSNTSGSGGFVGGGSFYRRCISHDNTGSNSCGFRIGANSLTSLSHCIADTNGGDGIFHQGVGSIVNCDSYNNGGDGIDATMPGAYATLFIENCNLIKNGAYGIASGSASEYNGLRILNCGFGAGTEANTSGQTNLSAASNIAISGSVTYADDVTPWVDPGDGDFRISLAAAKNAGRGAFTQTQSGYGDPNATVAYLDIGAAQHDDSGSGGGGIKIAGPGGLAG